MGMKTKTALTIAFVTTIACVIFVAGVFVGMRLVPPRTIEHTIYAQTGDDKAKEAVGDFLSALHGKEYARAVQRYGGDYDTLRGWNPDTSADDLVTLWRRGCEQNGLNCLEVRNLDTVQRNGVDFVVNVWFTNSDGITEFSRGACCGGKPLKEPQHMFPFTVHRDGEVYRVMTMPPYTP
jgi:hypothetical protein